RFADGTAQARFTGEANAARSQVVSMASEAWYGAMTETLERFIDYAQTHYEESIVGYLLAGGITHEWGLLGSFGFIDYSAPMRRWWARWVAERYPQGAPYDATRIPSPEERLRHAAGNPEMRDEAVSRAAIDFQLCLSDLVAERVAGFCATVKRMTARQKLTCVYYGYTLTCRESGLDCLGQFLGRYGCGGFQGGHLAMQKVLASPDVDMITSPFSYANRRLGTGDVQPHYAETSVTLAGKISFLQDDNRSWKGFDQRGLDTGFYSDAENCLKQLWRSFARRMCGDDTLYFMDLLGDNYEDGRIGAELRKEQALFERWETWRGPSEAQLLIVVDEEAVASLSLQSGIMMRNVYRQAVAWARTGVPFHVVLATTVPTLDLAPYTVVFFINAVTANAATMAAVERIRAAEKTIVLWPDTAEAVLAHCPEAVRVKQAPASYEELGRIAAASGAHRYATHGERIWRCGSLLAVHLDETGESVITLSPGRVAQEGELFSGSWECDGSLLRIHASPHDTWIGVCAM
ncbi:MAG: hypothetical protein FWF84_03555, partial [Kiritimatiellaeota bacterium]|nr:hypothetical protein [Kiritimatiellota bacterium]